MRWRPLDRQIVTQRCLCFQPRHAHAIQKALHEFGGLVGDVGANPGGGELRLVAAHDSQERACLVDLSGLRKACAAEAMRALKAGTEPRGLGRVVQGIGVAPGHIVSNRNGAEELGHQSDRAD